MIDLHTHVLPGIDDGVESLEEAVAVVRGVHAAGVTIVVATPHVREDYPTTPSTMEQGVAALRRALGDARIPVEIATGGEVALDRIASLDPGDLDRFSLGASGRYVLLEFPYHGWPSSLEPVVHSLAERGMTAVIGHPERNAEIVQDPTRLAALTTAGCVVQVTAGSLTGAFGRSVARAARRLLELGLVNVIATDLHGLGRRDGSLAEALTVLDDRRLADYLAHEAPAAVLRGDAVPPPPPARHRRARWRPSIGRR